MRIDTRTGRSKLKPRKEPYYHRLRIGTYLGYRALAPGVGTWIARRLIDQRKYAYKPLGAATDSFGFEQAQRAAESWIAEVERGIGVTRHGNSPATVETACREYVDSLKRERPKTAYDADKRFARTVYGQSIARMPLEKLREKHLRDWRDSLALSKGAANRELATLRAALNHAVNSRLTGSALAFEVSRAKKFKNAGKPRDLYLDKEQRRRLLEAAKGPLRDVIEAAILTGARPGELISARRSAFDARTGSITFSGKVGSRTVPLSPAACALFARLAKDKLPQAFLLTRDNGESWASSDWDVSVRAVAKAAGLPATPHTGVCLYTLRHSFITEMLVTGGMSTLSVAKLTGTSLKMIETHYGHLVSDHVREQLARVALL